MVATFGAGLFTGLAPAAGLTGPWLPAALVAAAALGYLILLSTWECPLDTVKGPVRRVVFGVAVGGRLAAAVAVAGTFGRYSTPASPATGALLLTVVVTAVAVAAPRLPVAVVRAGAVVVLLVLVLVAVSCFAIAPEPLAVAVSQGGGGLLEFVAGVGLLTVCFLGASPTGRPVVDVELPPIDADGAGRTGSSGQVVRRSGGLAWIGGRVGLAVLVGLVLVVCSAVAAGALRQLGAARLAVSPAPLVDALAAADAAALEPLLLTGVAVGCAFVLLGVLRGLTYAARGVPAVRVAVAAGIVVAAGSVGGSVAGGVVVTPVAALVTAAALLSSDALLRYVAVRHQRIG